MADAHRWCECSRAVGRADVMRVTKNAFFGDVGPHAIDGRRADGRATGVMTGVRAATGRLTGSLGRTGVPDYSSGCDPQDDRSRSYARPTHASNSASGSPSRRRTVTTGSLASPS